MSIAATNYALTVAREVPHGTHGVLFALAARAGASTATTFTGKWLQDALGMSQDSVQRHLTVLRRAGVIAVDVRPGRASVVRFPLAAVIHTPRESAVGAAARPTAESRYRYRESAVGGTAKSRHVSGSVSGTKSATACAACGHHVITADGICSQCLHDPRDAKLEARLERERVARDGPPPDDGVNVTDNRNAFTDLARIRGAR